MAGGTSVSARGMLGGGACLGEGIMCLILLQGPF